MNKDIHPNWHTTDDEEVVPVRVVQREEKKEMPTQTMTVSRRPAAIFGILLVVGMTTFFYHGVQNLTGQIAGGQQI